MRTVLRHLRLDGNSTRMTSTEPSEPEKKSIDEFLLENTNVTPEDLEQAKKEAERDARHRQRERENGDETVVHDSEKEFDKALKEEVGKGYSEDVSEELEKSEAPRFEDDDFYPTEEFDD